MVMIRTTEPGDCSYAAQTKRLKKILAETKIELYLLQRKMKTPEFQWKLDANKGYLKEGKQSWFSLEDHVTELKDEKQLKSRIASVQSKLRQLNKENRFDDGNSIYSMLFDYKGCHAQTSIN